LYCQCGRTSSETAPDSFSEFPSLEEVEEGIANRFRELALMNILPDTITFSGNGEPTLHPAFAEVFTVVKRYQTRYLPESKIGVLTNGSGVSKASVFEALVKLDWKSIKLDAGRSWMNHPQLSPDLEDLIPIWKQIPDLTIQSFFSEGRVANSQPRVVERWIEQIQRIRPRRVHIYTLDRKPALPLMEKASLATLTQVARRLALATGVRVEVFG
jgi:wyosine [tRNA(Phe)-imidazoG37] synthetase (radical SAM superfamily)